MMTPEKREPEKRHPELPQPVPATPRWSLSRRDKVTILHDADRVVDYVPHSSDDNGHVLRPVNHPDLCQAVTHEEFERLRQEGRLSISRGFFGVAAATARMASSARFISELSPEKREKLFFRKDICDAILRAKAAGEVSLSEEPMRAFIKAYMADVVGNAIGGGRCGGKDIRIKRPPSPAALRDWLRKYEACAFDPMSLADGYGNSGNTTPRLGAEERALMRTYAEMTASRLKPSAKSLHRRLIAEIKRQNGEREAQGLRPLHEPSYQAFLRVVNGLDEFWVAAGQEGIDAARKKYHISQGGLDVRRPLERLEMDEWNIQLKTLLEDAQVWSLLPPKLKDEVERRRFWLSWALDACTRCCLAAMLVENPSASSAVATLRMAVNDKSALLDTTALTPWDMFGTSETVSTDSGSSYVSHEFRSAVTDLGSEALFAQAGMPQMRGRGERFNRTLHEGLIAHFHGRTFKDIVEKGDYDSDANAVLDVAELGRMIVRWIVDVYHNTPHAGLGGETPRNCWLRLTRLHPVLPPPDPDLNRHIFGVTVERRITGAGVRVLGLQYRSEPLMKARRDFGQKPVLVRIDEADLGHVSVRTKQGWLTVRCERSGFDHVSVAKWRAARTALRRGHARNAKLSEAVVYQAIRDIHEFSDEATRRAGIASPILTSAEVDRLERDLFRSFSLARGPEDGPPVLGIVGPDGDGPSGMVPTQPADDDNAGRMDGDIEGDVPPPANGADDDFFTED
ncbi:Mu transposase C-terminal domain-containing protein [Microvirga sp. P5_D2]|jgi:putative transposase